MGVMCIEIVGTEIVDQENIDTVVVDTNVVNTVIVHTGFGDSEIFRSDIVDAPMQSASLPATAAHGIYGPDPLAGVN
jgi:hypothetical protein